jgi:hypothetical protein
MLLNDFILFSARKKLDGIGGSVTLRCILCNQMIARGSPGVAEWNAKHIEFLESVFTTSMTPARVTTDAGSGFLKSMGCAAGEHCLACELVGTMLADWLGLPTLDFSIISVTSDVTIPLGGGRTAAIGPGFITRAVKGRSWSGTADDLCLIDNPADVTTMVIFDTWTLNCDRFRPQPPAAPRRNVGNVFFTEEGASQGRYRLLSIDHNNCFTCGRDLAPTLAHIDRVQHDALYGLFPEFRGRIDLQQAGRVCERLSHFRRSIMEGFVNRIPSEWNVTASAREALCRLVTERAAYVSHNASDWLKSATWSQADLPF